MKPNFRLLKNAAANLARGGVGALVAVLLPALLVRHMSGLSYGVWCLVLQVAAYVAYLDFGLQTAIGRFVAFANEKNDPEGRDSIVSTAFAALCGAGLLSILFIGIAVAFAIWIFPHVPGQLLAQMRWTLAIVGVSMALGLPASAWNGVFVGLQRFEIPAITLGGAKLLSAAVIATVVIRGHSLITMAMATASVNLISYAIQYWLFRALAPDVRLRWSLVRRSTARELGVYCAGQTIWSFAMLLVNGLDLILVGRFDFRAVGPYAVASSLIALVAGIQYTIFGVMMPHAAATQVKKQPNRLGELVLKSTRLGSALLFLSGLFLFLYSAPLMKMWVGPDYAVRAYGVLPVLLLANVLRLIWVPYSVVVIATAQQRSLMIPPFLESLTNVAASLWLGSHWGAIGVAYGTLIGAAVGSIVNLLYSFGRTRQQVNFGTTQFLYQGVVLPSLAVIPILSLLAITTGTLKIPAEIAASVISIFLGVVIGYPTTLGGNFAFRNLRAIKG